ncbi:MAG: hypothetical protein N3F63_05675 [Thermoplasmata archaeon]|nr:hypothetical protein [Thermoplasmata archaeon]
MKEQELTRLEKLNQVRKILTWVVFAVFFLLIVVFLIVGGNLNPFYLPIPDAVTVCFAGIFTATWFFGAFALGEIAFEVSDTRRVLSARKHMKKSLVYAIILIVFGAFMFHPALPLSVKALTKTDMNTGYGKYFNISFTPRDPHGFSYAETFSITVTNGCATVVIAEVRDFTENYASGRYHPYFNQTLNNTTTGVKSCAQFLTPDKIGKEYVFYIVKQPDANVRIVIEKTVRVDAFNSWGMLMLSSGVLLIVWVPVTFALKKKFEKGSVVR